MKWLPRLLLWNDSACTLSPLGNRSNLPTLASVRKTQNLFSDRLLLRLLYMSDGSPFSTLTSLKVSDILLAFMTCHHKFHDKSFKLHHHMCETKRWPKRRKGDGVFKETLLQDNLWQEYTKIISEFKNFLRD